MRAIGLHLRLKDTIHAVAKKAASLQLPVFQCFLLQQTSQRLIAPSNEEIRAFGALRASFDHLFVHASYWTNLASIKEISTRHIEREMRLASRLGFSHIVIH